jgi:hypothetical protein
MKRKRSDFDFKIIGVTLIFALSLAINLYFCFQKAGFHEDEYYTYFSSNRSIGLYQPDREWQDNQTILTEFTVKPGERFNYGLVKLVQSWDVHPPLYYYIFHTVCSFFPLVFTKWSGLITNLLAFILAFYLFNRILQMLEFPDYLRFTILALWGMNPQTVSATIFIRMYAWLTVFILLCAMGHIAMIMRISRESWTVNYYSNLISGKFDLKVIGRLNGPRFLVFYLIPLMITSFFGFLTQYFYLFFFVPIGFIFTIWLVFWKNDIKKAVYYVLSCVSSMVLAVLAYPASLHHLFGGYRGTEAAGSLLDIGNTFMRIGFFLGLLDDFVLSGVLIVIAIVIVALLVAYLIRTRGNSKKKRLEDEEHPELIILGIAIASYFLLTANAALLVGRASNRYEMPIYALVIMMIFILLDKYLEKLNDILAMIIIPLLAAAVLIKGYAFDDNVLFEYREDIEKVNYATQNSDQVAIVMFNPATPHNVWRLTDELLEYKEVFYMDEENLQIITDEKVTGAEKIILYIADDEQQETAIQNLMLSADMKEMTHKFTEDMWNSYELSR